MSLPELLVCELGTVGYRRALALQERIRSARQAEGIADTLLLLEHPPVFTRGRRSTSDELSMGEAWYREQGIDVVDTDRGGRVTYHGPGQLVGYPIMAIGDVIAYLRTMEQAIVETLADAGVSARARPDDGPDFTGVWAGERKVASIGVHVARGVTTHGFAINVDNDLGPFGWIVPCGLAGVQMTSVAQETGTGPALPAVRASAARRFAEAFGRRPRPIGPADLDAELGGAPPTAPGQPSRARLA